MTPKAKAWIDDAVASGMKKDIAYLGSQVITSFEQFWNYEIPEEGLKEMKEFGLGYPQAASHRWSLLGGPRPYVETNEGVLEKLKDDPFYSPLDFQQMKPQS